MTLLSTLQAALPSTLSLLERLVALESPTLDKAAVDAVGAVHVTQLKALGAEVRTFPQAKTGDHVMGVFSAGVGVPLILVMHMDTVHPRGTLASMPIKYVDGRLHGPGVYDMKASHVIALSSIRALVDLGQMPSREIRVLFTADEETGSHTSRQLIEDQARGCALALVMEPALADGRLKSARKGTGLFTVTAHGRAAHAGGDHEKGINAIQELAHQVLAVQSWTDYARGLTVSVGDIRGGGVTNVVPDVASFKADLRIARASDGPYAVEKFMALKPVLPGARVTVEGGLNRPPMECDAGRLATVERINALAQIELGRGLGHAPSGGGSDASFTAGIGVPTMDGLGAVGDGAHALHEHIVVASLPERAAVCAAILRDW
jgi:glutamate carboxypeptidase